MNINELESHIEHKIKKNIVLKYNFGVIKPKVTDANSAAKAVIGLLVKNDLINKQVLDKIHKLI